MRDLQIMVLPMEVEETLALVAVVIGPRHQLVIIKESCCAIDQMNWGNNASQIEVMVVQCPLIPV